MDEIDYETLSRLIREQIEWDQQYWWDELNDRIETTKRI